MTQLKLGYTEKNQLASLEVGYAALQGQVKLEEVRFSHHPFEAVFVTVNDRDALSNKGTCDLNRLLQGRIRFD